MHYVRSGDFVEALLREAHDVNEYAFALGAVAHYTADNIDWLAVYDVTSDRCYYIPAVEFKDGMWCMHLRLTPPARRRKNVRFAKDYVSL